MLGILTCQFTLCNLQDFVALYQDFDSFFMRHMYHKVKDCWNMPISSCPAAEFDIMERITPDYNRTFRYVDNY